MASGQMRTAETFPQMRPHAPVPRLHAVAPPPDAWVIESRGGRIAVQHVDGYVFVFQIHDLEDLVMNLEQVTWSSIGAPPDAEELEQQARAVAEAEARTRGWLS